MLLYSTLSRKTAGLKDFLEEYERGLMLYLNINDPVHRSTN
jgi:hypothetical protein